MNILLKDVICTSKDGDRFWKMTECYIQGNSIKYLRLPEEIVSMVEEEALNEVQQGELDRHSLGMVTLTGDGAAGGRGRGRGRIGGRGRGRDGPFRGGRGGGRFEGRGSILCLHHLHVCNRSGRSSRGREDGSSGKGIERHSPGYA